MAAEQNYAEAYLAKLSVEKRATLEKVRAAIRAAAPEAVEGVSYGLPAFIQGKAIAGYSASANHCSYFPMSGSVVKTLSDELDGYETSKGAIRFPIGKPPPAALIRKLVKARLAEVEGGTKTKQRMKKSNEGDGRADVNAFLRSLDHPLKREIETVRELILGADPAIGEGIKWKAPSFRTSDYFATFNLRSKDGVQLIFHTGVKPKGKTLKVDDPGGLIEWLAKDRCMVTMGAGKDIGKRRAALQSLVRAWIKQL